jgi:acetyl esterase/lipase
MIRLLSAMLVVAAVGVAHPTNVGAFQDEGPSYTRKEDVIYARKFGTALTLDVFQPKKSNGVGLIFAVSGGWFSAHEAINILFVDEFLKRGYTVFAVVHGSQPKFTIPEILEDMHRAVRFIRQHAKEYGVDPDRLGMYGGSAGGHLSLMQGTAGKHAQSEPNDDPKTQDPKNKDPMKKKPAGDAINRLSSRVQAVACFFPPTDFLNYGSPGEEALGGGILKGFKAPFDFQTLEKGSFVLVTDSAKRREIGKAISPIYHVSKDTPPTLIIHGDADKLVPIQQAEIFIARMKEVGATGSLVVRKGAGHGWVTIGKDLSLFADWFDEHLRKSR